MKPAVRRGASIAGIGLLTGALTQLGQGVLPEGWGQIANAMAPWLLIAFLLAATMPDRRWAVAAGIGSLFLALVGYYALIQLRFGYGGSTSSWIFWSLGAIAGGTVFGWAGHVWRTGTPRERAVAIGLAAAAFVAEGIYLLGILPEPAAGVGFIAAGAVLPLVLGRSWPDRVGGYVAAIPALALGAIGYLVFLRIYDWTSGIG